MANALIPIPLLLAFINAVNLASSQRQMQESCQTSGYLTGTFGNCNRSFGAVCCEEGKRYPQYRCSPPVTAKTPAQLNLNSFEGGGDGGGPSACDGSYHSNSEMVVALSTGWYADGSRCLKSIRIHAEGKTAVAKVVDECGSVLGCDKEHGFQPPCPNNVVNASPAVLEGAGAQPRFGRLRCHLGF